MLTVITPTMWKHAPFIGMLERLVSVASVGEILIIDNHQEVMPNADVLKHSKVRVYKRLKNMYVCPAWNLAVSLAKHDKLAFLADDIDVDVKVFDEVDTFLNDKVGMITVLSPDKESDEYEEFLTSKAIKITKSTPEDGVDKPNPIGIGNLFFMMKKHWLNIPDKLKIMGGASYQWNKQHIVRQNYIVYDCEMSTPHKVTIDKLEENPENKISEILRADETFYNSLFGSNV